MSCGVGCRRGSDPALLWLWRRPVATAPIRPLAWEPPYAAGAAQEIATTTQKTKKKKKKLLLNLSVNLLDYYILKISQFGEDRSALNDPRESVLKKNKDI